MKKLAFVVLAPAVFALCAGLQAQEKKKRDDKARLQGTWQTVKGEEGGEDSPDAREHKMVFKGGRFSLVKDGEVMLEGTYRLDPTQKPKQIDLTITGGKAADDMKDKTALGIYDLKKDELRWCVCRPGDNERPREFSTTGTKFLMAVLKREEKK